MVLRNAWRLGRQTVAQYLDNGGPLLGAALAFWAILSVAPLVLIVLSTIRWVLGDAAASADLPGQLSVTVEPHAADWVESLVDNLRRSEAGPGAGAVGTLLLLWSASRLFRQMQEALNQLWRIRRDPIGVRANVVTTMQRGASAMAMVFVLGGTLVLAIVLSSMAAAVRGALGETLPGSHLAWSALTLGLSVSLLGGLFAAVYRLLPDARVAWRDPARMLEKPPPPARAVTASGRTIVVMGDGPLGRASCDATLFLVAHGFPHVLWYRGGEQSWAVRGYGTTDSRLQ